MRQRDRDHFRGATAIPAPEPQPAGSDGSAPAKPGAGGVMLGPGLSIEELRLRVLEAIVRAPLTSASPDSLAAAGEQLVQWILSADELTAAPNDDELGRATLMGLA